MNSYAGLTTQILTMVDTAIQGYTQGTYQALSAVLTPTLELSLLLYVMVFGIAHLSAEVPFSLTRSVRHMVVAAVVVYFVTNWDFFALYSGTFLPTVPPNSWPPSREGRRTRTRFYRTSSTKGSWRPTRSIKRPGCRLWGF
jgi:hypothetical protein